MKSRASLVARSLCALTVLLVVADAAAAQGRGRGPSEAMKQRSGSWFAAAELGRGDKLVQRLTASAFVRESNKAGALSLFYVFDSKLDPRKQKMFEQSMFGSPMNSIALRRFRCASIDLANDESARKQLKKRIPTFFALSAKGKFLGKIAFGGYKARPSKLTGMLGKAISKHSKFKLSDWTKQYYDVLQELQNIEGKERSISQRRQQAGRSSRAKSKLAKLDKEAGTLAKQKDALMAKEEKLVAKAKLPTRPAGAKLLGQRERRGR